MTGIEVSEIGFGAWAIGGGWGPQQDAASLAALHRALDLGVNFIDTAAGYGNGHSERLIGQVLRERKETVFVATKTPPMPGEWPPSPYDRDEERYSEAYLRSNIEERLRKPGQREDRPASAAHMDARVESEPSPFRGAPETPGRG
jgi:aryl-alcohol dehydrogenase-like predicted oxidoreductase